ncbi:Uncharacterised protein [Mycobacteroides abscessus subsp. massiliense]|nr:Uncharacterised protein [Mycobacteroides abscessus subsp. massiliense]
MAPLPTYGETKIQVRVRSPALNGTKENCLIGYKSKTESLRTLIIVQNYCALIGVRLFVFRKRLI